MSLRPQIPLQDGETIAIDRGMPLSASIGQLIFTLGIFELFRRTIRFVVTDRRVIALRGLPGMRKVKTLPLDRIQDVSAQQHLWLGEVTLSTAGGVPGIEQVRWLTISQARDFANEVAARSRRDVGQQAAV